MILEASLGVSLLLSFITAFIIAFFTSPAGVSGAFLLMPFQISVLSIITPSANATNFLYNVIAIPSGVYKYWKEGRFLWILAIAMIAGYIPGILLGTVVRTTLLFYPEYFKKFVGIVLLYLAFTLVRSKRKYSKIERVNVKFVSLRRVVFGSNGHDYEFNPLSISTVSFVVGIIGGCYGVGGGALMSPILVGIFKLPVHAIAGANLFGTFVSSVVGVVSYTVSGWQPRIDLGLAFGFGGMLGMYLGAHIQKFMPERLIRSILAVLITVLALKYIVG
ncbi:sulfite exporter TauE/SafE family protein [Archaeoglobus profundus]|uniref:Probable membrane transporter protein n=1 Tax=Archaeoglobus profundus (strain DSM 5631 / JCM 9629 / NBRC 100127 / Av18) TaxID=572546 RepID=D2RHM2_ARCPA|nr:sulfite exporter TauE/SafE family protein [Archaeoglobus profundus]ADB57797.1 protein of unknown function DUF81 [Archaeoglobus profundus DSM 5631]